MAKYLLIKDSKCVNEIGFILQVKENETTENELMSKFKVDVDRSFIELSALEYNYYEKFDKNERINLYNKDIFSDICNLTPGDKFKVTLTVLRKENRDNEIHFKCKNEYGDYYDIPASSINEIMKFEQSLISNGFYMLSMKYIIFEIGAIVQVYDGTVKELDTEYTFIDQSGIKDILIKLDKYEARFLQKFPVHKRMKKHERGHFRTMKELQVGQQCYLRSDECRCNPFEIIVKSLEFDGIKFDLKEKNNYTNILRAVEASDIKLPKGIRKSITDLASSTDIQISGKFDHSNEIQRVSKIVPKIEEKIFCEIIELKVINPDAIRNLDSKNKTKFNKFIVIINNKKKKSTVKLLWKGLIDSQICLGCELLQDWDNGTDGWFNEYKLFDCKENRGILIPLNGDMDSCESINGSNHKSLKLNQIITEDQICCVEFNDINELEDYKIYKTNISGKPIEKKDVKWTGLVNGKESVGLNCNNENYRGKYKKNGIIDAINICRNYSLSSLVLIQMNDTHIEFIEDIYVSNKNDVSDWKTVRANDKYKIGQLVQAGDLYAKVEFFVDEFNLVGIILDDELVNKNHALLKNILFENQILNQSDQFILVTIDSVKNFIGEFDFKSDSYSINEDSIKLKSKSESEKFQRNDIIKSNKNGLTKHFKVQNFWNLNGVQCLSATKTISPDENIECEYLREIDVCNVNEIKTEYYLETFIKPASIVTFEKSSHKDFNANDDVEFRSRISDESFKGTIRAIVKANGILSGIIELKKPIENDWCHCKLDENDELSNSLDGEYSQNYIVPTDILKKLEGVLDVNYPCVLNPQSVNASKGKSVEEKYIIYECDGKQQWALLKWKGIINNNMNCIGCDLKVKSQFGTNGTFGNQSLFECDDGCGVLIPLNKIENCCVTNGHKILFLNQSRVDEKTICCIKPINESKLNIRININERIRKIKGKETGIFKWVGLVNKREIIGLDLDPVSNFNGGTNGTFCGVKLFNCKARCGALFEPTCFECEFKFIESIHMNIIDPFIVKGIKGGKSIRKIMHLNNEEGKKVITIKWRGIINEYPCVGCELANDSEYGTDGTFHTVKLFNCRDRSGVLIPISELGDGCESNTHKKIVKHGGLMSLFLRDMKSINPDNICCVEWSADINKWPQMQIQSKVRYKNQDIYGTCKWIGLVNGKEAVGVEMDNECKGTNGRFSSFDLFSCQHGKGLLFIADDIEHDPRYVDFRYQQY